MPLNEMLVFLVIPFIPHVNGYLFYFAGSQFPDLLALPVHIVENLLKALKLNSEEARLKFPRLLQIIELYPSETLDIMTKEVSVV